MSNYNTTFTITLYLHYFLLIIITFSTLFFPSVNSTSHPQDIRALKSLKHSLRTIPPVSCLSSWDFSVDLCDHIFTDKFTCALTCYQLNTTSGITYSRVTAITLDSAGYSGSLSSTSWNQLTYLQTLDISDSAISGHIPHSLSNLTRLSRLSLSKNSLSGEIPLSLCSLFYLEEFYLDNNNLTGRLPSSFSYLISSKTLEIQRNNITGELPDLSLLNHLHYFDASDNKISQIPSTFPVSLVEVSMRNNGLRGNIPNNIGELRFLQVLDLSHNELCGAVLSVVFYHPSLEQLTLSYNNFTSLQVPTGSGFTSNLIAVDLSYNGLRGLLPGFLGLMPRLSALSLEHNKFTGKIPTYAVCFENGCCS